MMRRLCCNIMFASSDVAIVDCSHPSAQTSHLTGSQFEVPPQFEQQRIMTKILLFLTARWSHFTRKICQIRTIRKIKYYMELILGLLNTSQQVKLHSIHLKALSTRSFDLTKWRLRTENKNSMHLPCIRLGTERTLRAIFMHLNTFARTSIRSGKVQVGEIILKSDNKEEDLAMATITLTRECLATILLDSQKEGAVHQ